MRGDGAHITSGSDTDSDALIPEPRAGDFIDPELNKLLASFTEGATNIPPPAKDNKYRSANLVDKLIGDDTIGRIAEKYGSHSKPKRKGSEKKDTFFDKSPTALYQTSQDGFAISTSGSEESDDSDSETQLLAAMEKLAQQRRVVS